VAIIAATARPVGVAVSMPFAQCAQQDSALTKLGNNAGDFGDRAAQPIDGGDHHGVTGTGIVEHRHQPRPVRFRRTRQLVGEHPIGLDTSGGERRELGIEILAGVLTRA
jgi:hypothetical protein